MTIYDPDMHTGWLTTAEAARDTGLHQRAIRRHCHDGLLRGAVQIAGIWLIPPTALTDPEWLCRRRRGRPRARVSYSCPIGYRVHLDCPCRYDMGPRRRRWSCAADPETRRLCLARYDAGELRLRLRPAPKSKSRTREDET